MIGVEVKCDVQGCGSRCVVPVELPVPGVEVIDLSAHTDDGVMLEALFRLPAGWRCMGRFDPPPGAVPFRVVCSEHPLDDDVVMKRRLRRDIPAGIVQ